MTVSSPASNRYAHRYADFRDPALERSFVGALMFNKEAFKNVALKFNPDRITSDMVRRIFEKMVAIYSKDGVVVRDNSIVKLLNIDASREIKYTSLMTKMKLSGKRKHSDEYILVCREQLERQFKARVMELGIRDILGCMKKAMVGDHRQIDKASSMLKLMAADLETRSSESTVIDPIKNFSNWIKEFEDNQRNPDSLLGIPTGIKKIDDNIVGLRQSELGIVVMDTGVGKSIFLMDAAINCYLKFGDIIYITIEMSYNQLESRFWCNMARVPYDRFRKLTLTQEDKRRIRHKVKEMKGHPHEFIIIDMKSGCTISDIVAKVKPYFDREKKPRLILVDYINIVASDETGAVDLGWEAQTTSAINMKQLICRRFKVGGWTGAQVTGDNMAFAKHIKDNVDIGIRIDEDENSQQTGVLDVSYIKSRDFRGVPHKIETNRSLMTMSKRRPASASDQEREEQDDDDDEVETGFHVKATIKRKRE